MAWLEGADARGLALGRTGGAPGGPMVVGVRVNVLFRYLGFGVLFVASLMFYVWSRIDVRRTAAELDSAVAWMEQLETEQEQLELELATRRDVSRLEAGSATLGLERDVPVVEVVVR
jgi:cell division protein FtsL